jgi:carbamoyl-phosphate synthase large subunit
MDMYLGIVLSFSARVRPRLALTAPIAGASCWPTGYDVERVHALTQIDRWFLYKLANVVATRRALAGVRQDGAATTPAAAAARVPSPLMRTAKQQGFSDGQIAALVGRCVSLPTTTMPCAVCGTQAGAARHVVSTELAVRAARKAAGIVPRARQIDTLGAEFPARTNYLYTTYNADETEGGTGAVASAAEQPVLVLGSGVYRIGSSVEFDWGAVSCIRRCVSFYVFRHCPPSPCALRRYRRYLPRQSLICLCAHPQRGRRR